MRLLLALAIILAIVGLTKKVKAHSWYPVECCSDRDCAPVPAVTVTESPAGFTIVRTGEFVERAKARRSQDEHFHVCRSVLTNQLLCLFVPDRGA